MCLPHSKLARTGHHDDKTDCHRDAARQGTVTISQRRAAARCRKTLAGRALGSYELRISIRAAAPVPA
jgi:hypothetical protein